MAAEKHLLLILWACCKGHVVKYGQDLELDWTCKLWTGLVKHGLDL
jgi:hypothetical protein